MSAELEQDLIQELQANRVTVVAGTGVSRSLSGNQPVADWKGLVQDGIRRCRAINLVDDEWVRTRLEEAENGGATNLISAAGMVQKQLQSRAGEFLSWLRATVGKLEVKDHEVARGLKALDVPIVTTNYDSLLEEALQASEVTWKDRIEAIRVLQGRANTVLHLHGHFHNPESVIFGPKSYEEVMGDFAAQARQQLLVASRTLLFLGYGSGLADPNFSRLIAWVGDVFGEADIFHYQLVLKDEETTAQNSLPANSHIRVLSYGVKHKDLGPYLAGLAARAGRPAELLENGPGRSAKVCLISETEVPPIAFNNLMPSDQLVGREDLMKELQSCVSSRAGIVSIALYGSPLVGKTELALHFAQENRHLFPGGVYVANFGGERRAKENLVYWGRALKVFALADLNRLAEFEPAQVREEINLRLAQDTRRRLFILDGAPNVEAALGLILDIDNQVYILTTRSENDAVQFRRSLNAFEVKTLDSDSAVRLFQLYAGDLASKVAPSVIREIVGTLNTCEIAALSIRLGLLAKKKQDLNLHQLADILRGHADAGDGAIVDAMASAIDEIDKRLGPEISQALRFLSVFPLSPSTFSRAAAEAVLGKATRVLADLVDWRYVQRMTASGNAEERYLLDRWFYRVPSKREGVEEAQRRMVKYYAGLLRSRSNRFSAIDLEGRNIETAFEYAKKSGMSQELVSLSLLYAPALKRNGNYDSARDWLERAQKASPTDTPSRVSMLASLGDIEFHQGRYPEALRQYNRAREFSSEQSIEVLRGLAKVLDRDGDNSGAEKYIKRGLELARNCEQECELTLELGWVYAHRGEYGDARRTWKSGCDRSESLSLESEDCSQGVTRCYLYSVLGWVEDRLGNVEPARRFLDKAEALARKITDPNASWVVTTNRCARAIHRGEYAFAARYLEEALLEAQTKGTRNDVNILQENLAIVYIRRGWDSQASQLLAEGLRMATDIGDPERISALLTFAAELALYRGENNEAERCLRVAHSLARRIQNPEREVCALWLLGALYSEDEKMHAEAQRILQKAHENAVKLNYAWLLAAVLNAQGSLFLRTDPVKAQAAFIEAQQKAREIESQDNQAAALLGLAKCKEYLGQIPDSEALWKEGIQMYREIGHRVAERGLGPLR